MGNSLPVSKPGQSPWQEKLGTLSLAWRAETGEYTTIANIPYMNPHASADNRSDSDFIYKKAGLIDVDISAMPEIAFRPLAMLSESQDEPHTATVLLQVRSDRV